MSDAKQRIEVDRAVCAGAGLCTLNVPKVFDQDDEEGLVVLLDPEPPKELRDAVKDAVMLCPSSAITLTEDEG